MTPNGEIGELDKRDALETGLLIRKELILIALNLALFALCNSCASGSWMSVRPRSSRHSDLGRVLRLEAKAVSNRKDFICVLSSLFNKTAIAANKLESRMSRMPS